MRSWNPPRCPDCNGFLYHADWKATKLQCRVCPDTAQLDARIYWSLRRAADLPQACDNSLSQEPTVVRQMELEL